MRVQEIEFKSKLVLNDIKLDVNKEITIYCRDDKEDKILRIVNINGKIVIFNDEDLDVELIKWTGHVPYKEKIREIEDEMLE